MACFNFLKRREKKVEPKSSNSTANSTFTDQAGKSDFSSQNVSLFTEPVRRGDLEFNSQNVSDASTDSYGRTSYPSFTRANDLRVFSFSELKMATKGFHRAAKIGEGGFGCVYKGFVDSLEDPETKLHVAVKQLGTRGFQGHKEWLSEVNVLGVVDHPNLVKLVGYCADEDERGIQRLLVYEYMPNRSVEGHLSSMISTPIPWSRRLRIAQDSARGLAYLHEGMDFQIIFRDFKSSNILLDEEWNAKLSDFGLARLGPEEGMTHISTAAVGTLGYAAPEYLQTGHLTYKSDVYGYGVFLYELLTGRRPIDRNRPKHEQKLIEWVKPHLVDLKRFRKILDPRLEWKGLIKSAQKLAVVANRCLVSNAKSRPKMSEVLEMINQIVEASSQERGIVSQISDEKSTDEITREVKRGSMDDANGEANWLSRIWSPKIVNSF